VLPLVHDRAVGVEEADVPGAAAQLVGVDGRALGEPAHGLVEHRDARPPRFERRRGPLVDGHVAADVGQHQRRGEPAERPADHGYPGHKS
jgi:hypothetical protein